MEQNIGKRILVKGNHPHSGKTGTVARVEIAGLIGEKGMVVDFDDGLSGFVFLNHTYKILN